MLPTYGKVHGLGHGRGLGRGRGQSRGRGIVVVQQEDEAPGEPDLANDSEQHQDDVDVLPQMIIIYNYIHFYFLSI